MPRVIIVFFSFSNLLSCVKRLQKFYGCKSVTNWKNDFFPFFFCRDTPPSASKYIFVLVFPPSPCPKYYLHNWKMARFIDIWFQFDNLMNERKKMKNHTYKELLKAYYTNFLIACASTLLKYRKPKHSNFLFLN